MDRPDWMPKYGAPYYEPMIEPESAESTIFYEDAPPDYNAERYSYNWFRTQQGNEFWGPEGAAGILFHHPESDTYLLMHRSPEVHHGNTWGIPGGAIDPGESPYQAALREAEEEMGTVPQHTVAHQHEAVPDPEWKYTTFVADVPEQFEPEYGGSWETQDHGWFIPEEIEKLQLHPGFANAWNSGGLFKQSMALLLSDRDEWIEDNGPYLEHWTNHRNVPNIMVQGIVPPEDPYASSWGGGYYESRPNHVYLAKPGYIPEGGHYNEQNNRIYEVPLRVDLRKLDPNKLKADEDHAYSNWKEWMEHADPETRNWMEENKPYEPEEWEPGSSRGEWAEDVDLDFPTWTNESLNIGSVAHEGPIPPEAIELHPYYMSQYDPRVFEILDQRKKNETLEQAGQMKMFGKHGWFYHTTPRQYREQIEQHGLLPTDEAPVSPWADKTGPERQQQPHGVYMWDHPSNAVSYAYNLEGRKPDNEAEDFPGDRAPLWEEIFESPQYIDYMAKYPGARDEDDEPVDRDDWEAYEQGYVHQPEPLYDVWKVNTLGYDPQIDPENAIHHGELTAEEAQQQMNSETHGWRGEQPYDPHNIERMEGHRWYVPHAIEPNRLTLHQSIYPEEMTMDNWEELMANQKEVPNAWTQVPLSEWNEKARRRYVGDPQIMRAIDPQDRTYSSHRWREVG